MTGVGGPESNKNYFISESEKRFSKKCVPGACAPKCPKNLLKKLRDRRRAWVVDHGVF
jgi:hypothetical protein